MAALKPLATIFVLIAVSAGSAFGQSDETNPLPIELKCPSENNGVLEELYQNKVGHIFRFEAYYSDSEVTFVSQDASEAEGHPWHSVVKILLSQPESDAAANYAKALVDKADKLMRGVCLASEATQKSFYAGLRANREKFGIP